jgi:hypothetical protein
VKRRGVCITNEAIIISERVDAYAWMILAKMEMTPGFEFTDIKAIYADGIHVGEALLQLLGIRNICRIVLGHQHLLSRDIRAWPKFFGLPIWATLLRDDCPDLV